MRGSLFTSGKARKLLFFLKSDPADLGQLRYRRILLATLSGWVARGVSIFANLISVPLAANYLGLERYGLWLGASSVLGWLALSDLGIGNHLTTLLARAFGRNDRNLARLYAATALWTITSISLSVGLVCVFMSSLVPWDRVFNITSALARSEAPAVAGLLITFALANLPLSLAGRIYYAYQEGWKANLWQTVSSMGSLVALLIAVRYRTGLPGLTIALAGVPLVVAAIRLLFLLTVDKPWLFSGPSIVQPQAIRTVMSGSIWMFLINVQSIFWLGKDNILIAQLLGPESVGPFNVVFRVYLLLLGLVIGQTGMSLWPAYAEATARNDSAWVRRAFTRSLAITLTIFGVFTGVFAALAEPIIHAWAGKALVPPAMLPWLLGVEFLLLVWLNNMGYLLMALGHPQVVAVFGLVGGIVSVLIAIPLAGQLGLTGVPIANSVALVTCMGVPLHLISKRALSTVPNIHPQP